MSSEGRGWLDAGARVVRVLLSDAKVRRDIDTVARHLDPDEAPELVRSVLWTDSGVTGTAVSVAPALLNAGIEAARELSGQARRLPPALILATTDQLLSKVRFRQLGVAVGQSLVLVIQRMRARGAGPADGWSQFAAGVQEALREAGIEPTEAMDVPLACLAARLDQFVRENPGAAARATRLVRRVARQHPDLARALRGELAEEDE